MSTDAYRYETVRASLLEMIASGALGPGDKAPSLRRLATAMRVSLSTASQAYSRLESEGVLEARPKSGFFIRGGRASLPIPGAGERPAPGHAADPAPINRAELIQKVLGNMSRRDTLPLGVARTAENLLPLAQLNRILGQVLRDEGERVGFYGPVEGHEPLRRQIALRMMEAGAECGVADTLVTAGAMEALHIALRCVARAGDTVVIPTPSYYCFLHMLENMGLRVVEVPSRPGVGVNPSDIAQAVDRFRVAACVLTPNFNNPDGALMPEEAKAETVALLAARGVPLIEDDVYGDMHFGPERPKCCRAYDKSGLVLHCSSFSKTISPGYRVGWLLPGRFMDKALEIKATINVSTATPTQMAVAEYLRSGHYHRHLKRLRPAVKAHMEAMYALVGRHFPEGTRATRPQGGSVMWLELPGGVDTVAFMNKALEHDITVAPGAIFSSQDRFGDCLRVSYCIPDARRVEAAVALLGSLARDMMA